MSMQQYKIAILNTTSDDVQKLIASLKCDNTDVVVYSTKNAKDSISLEGSTFPQQINFILKQEKNLSNRPRFLFVVQDCVIVKNCISGFMSQLLQMMKCLKMSSWLNTACDAMNYVYQKYSPRLQIDFGDDDAKKIGSKTLLFTSHSNTYMMCFDLDSDIEKLKFNEELSTPMYYTIEFLARRKKNDAFAFMNMYPTVMNEQNVFTLDAKIANADKLNAELIKQDDEKFKTMNIDYSADNNIEQLEQKLYDILNRTI